jgi:hypothetical protein
VSTEFILCKIVAQDIGKMGNNFKKNSNSARYCHKRPQNDRKMSEIAKNNGKQFEQKQSIALTTNYDITRQLLKLNLFFEIVLKRDKE